MPYCSPLLFAVGRHLPEGHLTNFFKSREAIARAQHHRSNLSRDRRRNDIVIANFLLRIRVAQDEFAGLFRAIVEVRVFPHDDLASQGILDPLGRDAVDPKVIGQAVATGPRAAAPFTDRQAR